jgi:hypothetical protein
LSDNNGMKLDSKRKYRKFTNGKIEQCTFKQQVGHWRNQEENLNFLESNENENIIYYKLWDIVKPILRRESA